jgi:hypothetical protein
MKLVRIGGFILVGQKSSNFFLRCGAYKHFCVYAGRHGLGLQGGAEWIGGGG